MKSILLIIVSLFSIPSFACLPSITKDVLLKVVQPGVKTAKLTMGGPEHLHTEVAIYVRLGENEEVTYVIYDDSVLSTTTRISSDDLRTSNGDFESYQFSANTLMGDTQVKIQIKNKKTKKVREVLQKVSIESLGTPRGC